MPSNPLVRICTSTDTQSYHISGRKAAFPDIAMQPRLHLFRARRPTMSIVRISHQGQPSLCLRLAPQRSITSDEKPLPKADEGAPGPNQEQLPHVSEEAASMSKITGGGGPEIEEQGTPVDEVLKRDQGSREKAPKVMKEPMQPASPTGTRSFSTSTHPRQDAMTGFDDSRLQTSGHKFELPALPLAANMHLKYRYAPVVKQVTNLLMRDGKLSVAQRVRPSVSLSVHGI